MGEIKITHLVSGAPIIAKVALEFRDGGDYYILEDPLNILYSKAEDGKPKFTVFEMLVLSSDSSIEVAKHNMLYSYTPLPEIIDQYNAMLLNKFIPIEDDD